MGNGKALHAHGCRTCNTRYEDACATPKVDGECAVCRGLKPWLLLIENRRPKDCCRARSRPVTKDERERYALAGTRTWWICATCHRTHPYRPQESE